jgi:desulfoferrodoxin (superoxide reductase-like protein)
MEIITEDYGSYARTDRYITYRKQAIDIVLRSNRDNKKAMDKNMELIGVTYFFQYKRLKPNQEAKADFILAIGEEIVNVFCYCNLHGLWSYV